MNRQFYWQDWVTTALGVWIILSPLVIPFLFPDTAPISVMASWNHYIVGAAIVVISWAAITTLQDWEEWVDVALGIWLTGSPFVLGFANSTAITWNALTAGAAVVVIAIWARYSRPRLMSR